MEYTCEETEKPGKETYFLQKRCRFEILTEATNAGQMVGLLAVLKSCPSKLSNIRWCCRKLPQEILTYCPCFVEIGILAIHLIGWNKISFFNKLSHFFFFFFFPTFLGSHPGHMEDSRLVVESELQLLAYTTAAPGWLWLKEKENWSQKHLFLSIAFVICCCMKNHSQT